MKVAFVVPRYGEEVVGGAEFGARMLAEHIVSLRGWEVEVLTTCALDHMSWDNTLGEGVSELNGVRVNRFPSKGGRDPEMATLTENFAKARWRTSKEDAYRWVEMQGPVSPGLLEAVSESQADVVVFYPYLYHPTVHGVPLVGKRAVLQPAAHDELPLRLPVYDDLFNAAASYVFQTFGERNLVVSRFHVAEKPQVLVGLGVDRGVGDIEAAKEALGFDPRTRPYICCIGRVEQGKGCLLLSEHFARFKRRHIEPVSLVFVGRVLDPLPPVRDQYVLGTVDEGAKWGILENSVALVAPGKYESLSLTVLEALCAGIPVIVNGQCEATREHCLRSGAGWWFGGAYVRDSYPDFEAALEQALSEQGRAELAGRGHSYVEANFRWPWVIERYCAFLSSVADRAAA